MSGRRGASVAIITAFVVLALSLSHHVVVSDDITDRIPKARIMQEGDSGNLSVHVSDDFGRSIDNATVNIVELDIFANTNLTGWARFTDVPVDPNATEGTEYSIYATKTGYRSSELDEVTITIGNLTVADLEISGALLYGTVSDSLGPISGALVSIPTLGYSNITTIEGDFLIRGVPGAVPYAVIASATGYVNKTEEVILPVGLYGEVNFILTSLTGSISGTVVHAATLEPLSGAEVSVTTGTVIVSVVSGQTGFYRIPNLQSGSYNISVDLEGFELGSRIGVVVVSGSETEGVDFELVEKPTKLFGVVTAGTILLPGVRVTVIDTGLSANTSIYGYYEITNITAGTYDVVASLEGYDNSNYVVTITRGGELQLNINMKGQPGSLLGMVISSDNRVALSGVEVTIVSLGSSDIQRSTVTNSQGVFEFAGLAGGNYSIRLKLDGYKPREIGPVVVTQNASSNLNEIMLYPTTESFGGFIFGFDLAHSMMILALFLTIIILALAVLLRIRSFESPDKAPAVYDEGDQESADDEDRAEEEPGETSEIETKRKERKVRKGKSQ